MPAGGPVGTFTSTMPARPRTQPRKQPTQERARATVAAIIKATQRVLVRDGYEATSTNRVAQAAGVSIGSLYQYFPNKEALMVAVMEQHFEEMMGTLQGRLISLMGEPVPVVARALVHELIEMHRSNPALHRVLIEQVPRMGNLQKFELLDRRLSQLVGAYISAHRDEVDVDDVELTSYVLVKAAEALTHAAVLERPELLENGGLEEQIVRLVLSYLHLRERPSRRKRRAGARR